MGARKVTVLKQMGSRGQLGPGFIFDESPIGLKLIETLVNVD